MAIDVFGYSRQLALFAAISVERSAPSFAVPTVDKLDKLLKRQRFSRAFSKTAAIRAQGCAAALWLWVVRKLLGCLVPPDFFGQGEKVLFQRRIVFVPC